MRECLSNALAAWNQKDYATAIKEYLKNLIMASEQERMDRYQQEFCRLIVDASRNGIIFEDKNFKLQNDIFPKSPLVLWTFGNITMERDPHRSMHLYKQAATMSGGLDLVNTMGSIQSCRTTIVSTWHISMINDLTRNFLFNRALAMIVSQDSRVIDIGSGTGLLSMYAARYTRQPIVAIEGEKPMAQLGAQCVIANGLQDRVLIYPVMSSQFLPTVKPDVIVSETMDAGGLGEKIMQVINSSVTLLDVRALSPCMIFLDAHIRYRLGDPTHPITFCPSKIAIQVVVAQSDSFWRTRMHPHHCPALGCADTCYLRQHGRCLLSDHDMIRSIETDYTTMDPDDYDDLLFLTDKTEIFDVPLDNESFLSGLKHAKVMASNFALPIIYAGKADVVLLCWRCIVPNFYSLLHGEHRYVPYPLSCRATLAPGIELDSVRKGGWDYAAYPLQARTEYKEDEVFHGEFVLHFEQGVTINHIVDPATTPGETLSMVGPYDACLPKTDDGVVELVNNESLMRFLSSVPSRHSYWLRHGQDAYFPITSEGVLQYKYLERCVSARAEGNHPEFDTIFSVRAYGCLFKANFIDNCARQAPRALLNVDVRALDEYSLREYREIRGVRQGRIDTLSTPTLLLDLDPRRNYEPIVTGEQCQVEATASSAADGIVYFWVINGEWNNLEADLPLAAFLFDKRERVEQGAKMRFNVFLKDSEVLMSFGPRRITASPEDTALAAPATRAPPLQYPTLPMQYPVQSTNV
ncbi:prmt-9 [Pristionchus pacificus]|uniref:Protein arginine N-methyltransferase 6 n=1 Tax=Pristionchus pacificus TaxID=54126 RepID=A0A2A6BH74_PRIPA|nr:prmt-9 [Pristionchus pacificus]|eukprot:PDM65244.1 hypothetical protein PRIPAC_52186 [Pristionchus pacificus]